MTDFGYLCRDKTSSKAMKRLLCRLLALCLCLSAEQVLAQSKLDLGLLRMLRNTTAASAAASRGGSEPEELRITVLAVLTADASLPISQLDEMDVQVGTQVGRVVTMYVPVCQLEALSALPCIESLNSNRRHQAACLNIRNWTGVRTLQEFSWEQPNCFYRSFSGRDVLLGEVDTGFDYGHVNFRDPISGQTRLRGAVLYRPEEGAADSIREYYTDPMQLDTLTTDNPHSGHGTMTAGVAAGSYRRLQQQGMAPEADLMMCGTSVLHEERIIDALQLIFARAEELGEPCVVNLSIGNEIGWKDGKSPLNLACEALTDVGNAPGRVIVFSAGNDGECLNTASICNTKVLNLYTLLEPCRKGEHTYYNNPNFLVFCSDDRPVELEYLLYDTLHHSFADLPFEQHLTDSLDAGHDCRRALYLDCDTCDITPWPHHVMAARMHVNSDQQVSVYYINDESKKYRMYEGGKQWDYSEASGWFAGSGICSISDLCCTDAVLSVGAYSVVDSLTNVFGRTLYPTVPHQQVCLFSSYGYTSDQTPKPDVLCPGDLVVTSFSRYNLEKIDYYYTSGRYLNSPMMYVEALGPDPMDTYYWRTDLGTSLSSPCLAGIIALWMEACPTLTVNQIRQVLQWSSDSAYFGQELPGGVLQMGAGKVNALRGLEEIYYMMTPIQTVRDDTEAPAVCYDLQGRACPASVAKQGLFVIDGQKRIFR